MRDRPKTGYILAGVLTFFVLLCAGAAIFWQVLDCPQCAKPRPGGFMSDFHICKQGRVSLFQWWMIKRNLAKPAPAAGRFWTE